LSTTSESNEHDNRFLLVIIIVIALAASGGGVYFWTRTIAGDAARIAAYDQELPSQPGLRNEPMMVTIFHPENNLLVAEFKPAPRQPDAQAQARESLESLFSDRKTAQIPVLKDFKLRAFYLDAQGTAYVDLDQRGEIRASVAEEQLALYALVNTILYNFVDIRQVAFLIEGKESPTLAGHLDLSRRFSKRMDLVRK
jgi:sporulation and spore germination protein